MNAGRTRTRCRLVFLIALVLPGVLAMVSCSRNAPNKAEAIAAITSKLKGSLAPCELKEPLTDIDFKPFPPDKSGKPENPDVRLWEGQAQIVVSCPLNVMKGTVGAVVAVRSNGSQFLMVVTVN